MTDNGHRGPSRTRTSAATQGRIRKKTVKLIDELRPRLYTLDDDQLTALLLTVFDETARRVTAYAEGRQP